MKILIKIHRSPEQHFLVSLPNQKLIAEIRNLVSKGKHSRAIVLALSKGRLLGEVAEDDASDIPADLILTEKHAHFDLKK